MVVNLIFRRLFAENVLYRSFVTTTFLYIIAQLYDCRVLVDTQSIPGSKTPKLYVESRLSELSDIAIAAAIEQKSTGPMYTDSIVRGCTW